VDREEKDIIEGVREELAGIRAALEAGVDSVEHGAYMDADTVRAMAQSGAVWVPTLSTVGNLIGNGRFPDEVLRRILDGQLRNIAECARQGGTVALGSDAGAYCVFHAKAVKDEYAWLKRALGDETEALLAAGEAEVRRRFRRDGRGAHSGDRAVSEGGKSE
jgi:imidazolonepropionase-like amidohydrolase